VGTEQQRQRPSAAGVFRLDQKVAAVTGAGSGIGREIALLFARQGALVGVSDIDLSAAQAVAAEISAASGKALASRCDISKASDVEALFTALEAAWGGVDILVNNAGIADVGTIESTDEARFEKVMSVNLTGQYLTARRAVKAMAARGNGGVILNMSSIAALLGLKDRFAYSVSKGGVLAMTKSIAVDYLEKKIRCNCICPARIHTPFVDGFLKKNYPGKESEMFDKLSSYQPVGRMGRPDEVAAMALYLCAPESDFVTGQAFPLDGGVLLV
jgi:NAD(P)-dependent dehydrogenase (short-subunit alcohol dehydrogenase family)